MSSLSQFGFGTGIKSIQRLTVSQTLGLVPYYYAWPSSVSISPVNTAKTIVLVNYSIGYSRVLGSEGIYDISTPGVNLVSSTSLTIFGPLVGNTLFGAQFIPGQVVIQVVEFY